MRGKEAIDYRRKTAIERIQATIDSYRKQITATEDFVKADNLKAKIERHLVTIQNTEKNIKGVQPKQNELTITRLEL